MKKLEFIDIYDLIFHLKNKRVFIYDVDNIIVDEIEYKMDDSDGTGTNWTWSEVGKRLVPGKIFKLEIHTTDEYDSISSIEGKSYYIYENEEHLGKDAKQYIDF